MNQFLIFTFRGIRIKQKGIIYLWGIVCIHSHVIFWSSYIIFKSVFVFSETLGELLLSPLRISFCTPIKYVHPRKTRKPVLEYPLCVCMLACGGVGVLFLWTNGISILLFSQVDYSWFESVSWYWFVWFTGGKSFSLTEQHGLLQQ